MTNSNDPSNKSQSEKQAVPQTQSETNVVAASDSSSQPVHTAEVGRGTSVTPHPPPPRLTRPPATPPMPPSQPQVGGGRGIGGRGSGIPIGSGGIQVGGNAGGSAAVHQEARGGSSRPKRKAAETVAPAGVDQPICSECGKAFSSWKSLFGHMRAHPQRRWRGCFAPSRLQQPAEGEQGPHVVGDQVLAASTQEVGTGSQGSTVVQLDTYLNQPEEEENASASTSTSSPSNKDNAPIGGFDLNMKPTSDDDQDSGAAA